MGRLWAPWRSAYLSRLPHAGRACIFCRATRARNDRAAHVVFRGRRVFAILNRYPYTPGHLMVAPYRHVGTLMRVTPGEVVECLEVLKRMMRLLTSLSHPQGWNIGLNVGRAAGAGVLGHVHWHLVPRWLGDTNFMPATSGTKVISESLAILAKRLTLAQPVQRPALQRRRA